MTFKTRGIYASSSKEPRRGRLFGVMLVLGGLIAVTAVFWAVALTLSFGTGSTATEAAEQDGVTEVRVNNGTAGDVEILPSDNDTAFVEATVRDNLFSSAQSSVSGDETMDVEATCDQWFIGTCSVDYEVRVPPDTAVSVVGSTGNITVEGLGGNTEVEATTGDVTLSDTADVTAGTTTGNITLADADGIVDLGATTGDVTAAGVGESLHVSTTTGNINAVDFDAQEIEAASTTGDQTLSAATGSLTSEASTGRVDVVADDAFSGITVSATTGEVEVTVPEGVGPFRVDGESSTGEREIDVATDPDADSQLDLTTTTGDVRLSQQ